MTEEDSKTCTKCGVEKPLGVFYRDKSRPGGRHPWCRDCVLASRAAWYVRNRETNLAYQAKWREANGEKKAAYDASWREANLERKRANDAAWREENREYLREFFRQYQRPVGYKAEQKARRRARKMGVLSVPYRRRDIYNRDGGICQHCAKSLVFENAGFEIDHIVPLVLGGWDIPANLQVLCVSCNRRKSDGLVFTNPSKRSGTR